jgi:hypothetical protein
MSGQAICCHSAENLFRSSPPFSSVFVRLPRSFVHTERFFQKTEFCVEIKSFCSLLVDIDTVLFKVAEGKIYGTEPDT